MTETNVADETEILGERPFYHPLGEILLGAALVTIVFVIAAPGVTSGWTVESAWPALADMGAGVLKDAGWILPTFLAIILSFYAVLISLSVSQSDKKSIVRTRFSLGRSSQLIAIVTLTYLILAFCAVIRDPGESPSLLGLLAVGIPVIALGTKTGSFALGSNEEKREIAEAQKTLASEALLRLSSTSSAPGARIVIALIAVCVFCLPTALLWALNFVGAIGGDWVVAGLMFTVFGGIAFTTVNSVICLLFEEAARRGTTILNAILFGASLIAFELLSWLLVADSSLLEFKIAGGLLAIGILIAGSSVIPRFALNSSLKAISAARLAKSISRSDSRINSLD